MLGVPLERILFDKKLDFACTGNPIDLTCERPNF